MQRAYGKTSDSDPENYNNKKLPFFYSTTLVIYLSYTVILLSELLLINFLHFTLFPGAYVLICQVKSYRFESLGETINYATAAQKKSIEKMLKNSVSRLG